VGDGSGEKCCSIDQLTADCLVGRDLAQSARPARPADESAGGWSPRAASPKPAVTQSVASKWFYSQLSRSGACDADFGDLPWRTIDMTKLIGLGMGAVCLSAVSLTLGSGVALADAYAGQSYSDASKAISNAGQKAVIATSVGDSLSQGDCVVTRSQKADWLKGDNFSAVNDTVLLYLNCNAKLATAGKSGNSLGSPEGRAEKVAEEEQAAKDAAAAQQSQSSELATPGGN
jgi:hypothetical protein